MTWILAEDIECDLKCGSRFMERGSRHSTVQAARAMGWHCYVGKSLTDKDLEVQICPECIQKKKAKTEGGEDTVQLDLLG